MAEKKVSTMLHRITGAWVETGHEHFVRVALKCEYDFSKLTPRVKKVVIKALRYGVIGTSGGMAANAFRVVSDAYHLKYVLASKSGHYFYASFNNKAFYESIVAVMSLQDNLRGRDVRLHIHNYRGSIASWAWSGGPVVVQEIYKSTIGYPDKELREEAINFLSEGGLLVNTWVDKNPR